MLKPIHRDDIPMEVMAGIEAAFAESHPGVKVICAGDHPISESVMAAIQARQAMMDESFFEGKCLDCGVKMEGWPTNEAELEALDTWQKPAGWKHFTDQDGDICGFQCPECDAKENEGVSFPL